MFRKLFNKMQIKKAGKGLPKRLIIGNMLVNIDQALSYTSYSLQGLHTYEEVKKLNELTGNSAIYGYCKEKGPVAIIGVDISKINRIRFCEVDAYGEEHTYIPFEIERYSEDIAKQVGNYTVYGDEGIKEIKDLVKFDKIDTTYDSRYPDLMLSNSHNSDEPRVLKMACQLEGTYSFEEAENFLNTQHRWSGMHNMAYATLGNGRHVAIKGFCYEAKDKALGFRDVWEAGKPKPPVQGITFMNEEEASGIKDFSLYLYEYCFYYNPGPGPNVIKLDRTFSPNFDFYDTPDGKDLRLSDPSVL